MGKRLIKGLLHIFFCLVIGEAGAQRLYVHLDGGFMNYGGDLQDKLFTFNQANAVFGLGVYYQLSDHISVDLSLASGKLAASDAKSNNDNYRRNLSFYSGITEGSILFRGNLKNIPADAKLTPYLMGGIAFFHFDPYAFSPSGAKVYLQPLGTEGQGLPQYPESKPYKLTQIAIPFGGGITYALSDNILIGGEVSFRKIFTDHLDDLGSLRYADTAVLRAARGDLAAKMSFRSDETDNPISFNTDRSMRGNPNRNDGYYSCLIKIYVSLDGLLGASGNSGYSKKTRRQTSCPAKVL